MKVALLGKTKIDITPLVDNAEILTVTITSSQRKEPVSMTTQRDEDVTQLLKRLKGMFQALLNGEPKPEKKVVA